jgi:hypothetical protein
MDRHSRQMRLADVGPEGQACFSRAVVDVPGSGLAAQVAARYLAGAGVGCVRVELPAVGAAARAVDASVRVEILPVFPSSCLSPEALQDPTTRALATGALLALEALKAALRHGS